MTAPRPLLTVCIPLFDRADEVAPVLESVLAQDYTDWEVVLIEDASSEREAIRTAVAPFQGAHPDRIRYLENPTTLGYDRNFRRLVREARGRYVFILGNDDRVAPGAFQAIADALARTGEIGMFLRAYAFFRGDPTNIVQVNRFFPEARHFPPGRGAFFAVFRRLVSMSGLVFHRDAAAALETDRWDGTLFYQHWLAGNLAVTHGVIYLPDLFALFRMGGTPPQFGTAEVERGRFIPGIQPPETDLRMNRDILAIGEAIDARHGLGIMDAVRLDFARYAYPSLAHQAHQPWPVLYRYYRDLGALGYARSAWYHLWFWSMVTVGEPRLTALLRWVRRVVGHTPQLSRPMT